jgi:hypothetical protein
LTLEFIAQLLYGGFSAIEEESMTLFKRRTKRPVDRQMKKPLFLTSEHAPCTCPEPCERDHGNE